MNAHLLTSRSARRGFISTQAAIVVAVIIGGAGLLAYEWHSAHPGKEHHASGEHKHKHESKTAKNN